MMNNTNREIRLSDGRVIRGRENIAPARTIITLIRADGSRVVRRSKAA